MYIYDALASDNFLVVDKTLMQIFDIQTAVLIGELFFRRRMYAKEGKLTEDGFFYATIDSIQQSTTLSDYVQTKILTELQHHGLIKVDRRGLPAKRYIYLDGEAFQNLLDSKTLETPVSEELGNLYLNDSGQINNNIINNNNLSQSKDFDKYRVDRTAATTSKTSPSKLFSSPKTGKTKKQITQKINQFISRNQKEVMSRDYTKELSDVLDRYFRMLGESNTLLPLESINSQLDLLETLPENKRVQCVLETIQHGWKSLSYVVDSLNRTKVPEFDTAKNAEHYLRPKDAPAVDIIAEAKARGEEIF